MRNIFLVSIIASTFLALTACSKNNDPNTDEPSIGPAPVESNSPNTNYSLAFAGQTRINSVRTTTPYQAGIVTSALSGP
jgi:hypothetical protein